jgi:hypothetical protein
MSSPNTINEHDVHSSVPHSFSKSFEGEDDSENKGNISRIHIDLGKSVNSITLCAAFCGICAAVTVMTVWHSKDREIATESQLRKTQNHEDELTAQVKYLSKLIEAQQNVSTR